MSLNQAAIQDAILALSQVTKREEATTDPAELAVLAQQKDVLVAAIGNLALADLLAAARIVDGLIDAVEAVIGAARKGPFHFGFFEDLDRSLNGLQATLGQMHGQEALPAAPEETAGTMSAAAARPLQPAALPGAPSKKTDFASLKDEYLRFFAACEPRADKADNIEHYMTNLARGRETYEKVAAATGVPWFFVGIAHGMEGGFDFTTHLHNGDRLSARTVRVPAGRPPFGNPPFAWHDSAIDALTLQNLHAETDWSLARILFRFERFNGMGYRRLGVPSPYLWSHSNLYTKGKFTSDGHFDAEAVSKQTGAGVQLKVLVDRGIVAL
jgi:lysozyme family protein